jgi:hypothetical protein
MTAWDKQIFAQIFAMPDIQIRIAAVPTTANLRFRRALILRTHSTQQMTILQPVLFATGLI